MVVESDCVAWVEDVLNEVVAHDVADERDVGGATSGNEVVLRLQRLLESLGHPNRDEVVVLAFG